LFLEWSGNNIIFDNIFTKYGISLRGDASEHYLQAGVFNNVLDGDPIIFWQHETDLIIPLEAKQVFLVNCTKIEVRNLNPSGIGDGIIAVFCDIIVIKDNILTTAIRELSDNGIRLFNTNNSFVINNRVSNYSYSGILLDYAENITIIENTVFNNGGWAFFGGYTGTGISIDSSNNITIINNTVFNNTQAGIFIAECTKIIISKNNCSSNHHDGINLINCQNITVSENEIGFNQGVGVSILVTTNSSIFLCIFDQNFRHGIFFDESSKMNEVFLNDFINNNPEGVSQAYDDGESNSITNNYWNEWVTPDINDDGIVDTPYIIEGVAENFDHFPRTISSLKKFSEPIPPNVIFGVVFLILIGLSLRILSRKKEG
jgi:parallel beta-helix repeat protein